MSRLTAAVSLAAAVIVSTTETSSAAVRPPKLQYQMSTLPNGLTVVLEEDHSTPIVHLQLWYHVGSKNERAGRTVRLPSKCSFEAQPGDRLTIRTPGGGGFGDPRKR